MFNRLELISELSQQKPHEINKLALLDREGQFLPLATGIHVSVSTDAKMRQKQKKVFLVKYK